jgi:3',5'-cyclic AMP phosphodiesterase CpdA
MDNQRKDPTGSPSDEPVAPPVTPATPGSWRVVLLPDTQLYSERHPEIFESQTRWIAEHAEALDIRFVMHLGDVTNGNTPQEWQVARRAMSHLDGVVPYTVALGNHDMGPDGNSRTRETLLNEFFPARELGGSMGLGGTLDPGALDNAYHTFEAGGKPWIVLTLEYGPRQSVVEWANQVMAEHPEREAILITHGYLYFDGERYDWRRRRDQQWSPYLSGIANLEGGVHDGQELWEALVSRHPRFRFVFCGHVLGDGLARLSSPGLGGNVVHQVLVNYQMHPQGGEGFLRIVEFLPGGGVSMTSYSPFLDRYKTDPGNQFGIGL